VAALRALRRVLTAVVLAALTWWVAQSPPARVAWWLATAAPPAQYVVPIAGVRRAALSSSFGAPRSGSRTHQGIDIFAPRGTPVVAAARGVVTSTRPNALGGTVVWVVGAGRRLYYYAHLDRLDPDVRAGRLVEAGEPLGAVGDTGNARGGPPHLHFAIYTAAGAVDPYPLLADERGGQGNVDATHFPVVGVLKNGMKPKQKASGSSMVLDSRPLEATVPHGTSGPFVNTMPQV
jgi:hypothetical protein